jgi:hypothetical protein
MPCAGNANQNCGGACTNRIFKVIAGQEENMGMRTLDGNGSIVLFWSQFVCVRLLPAAVIEEFFVAQSWKGVCGTQSMKLELTQLISCSMHNQGEGNPKARV